MEVENLVNQTQSKYLKLNLWIIALIAIIVTDLINRDYLFLLSQDLIIFFQSLPLINISKFFSFLGTDKAFFIVFILSFNYSNLYKSFTIILVILFSGITTGVLKLIYHDPRPFFINDNIIPYNCSAGFGNPSGHSLCSMCVYLAVWHIFIYTDASKSSKFKRNSLLLILLCISLIMISRLFVGVHSLDQVLYGGSLGLLLYFFIFFILEINTDSPREFGRILKSPKVYYFMILNSVLFAFLFLYFFFSTFQNDSLWDSRITQMCPNLELIKKFEYESLIVFPLHCSSVFIYLSCYYDRYFNYPSFAIWSSNNFDPQNDMENLIPNENLRWNKTSFLISIFRLILLVSLVGIIFYIPRIFLNQDSVVEIMIIGTFLPASIGFFFIFFIFKSLSICLFLANDYQNGIDFY